MRGPTLEFRLPVRKRTGSKMFRHPQPPGPSFWVRPLLNVIEANYKIVKYRLSGVYFRKKILPNMSNNCSFLSFAHGAREPMSPDKLVVSSCFSVLLSSSEFMPLKSDPRNKEYEYCTFISLYRAVSFFLSWGQSCVSLSVSPCFQYFIDFFTLFHL